MESKLTFSLREKRLVIIENKTQDRINRPETEKVTEHMGKLHG
jgi:hypothetical protein